MLTTLVQDYFAVAQEI